MHACNFKGRVNSPMKLYHLTSY